MSKTKQLFNVLYKNILVILVVAVAAVILTVGYITVCSDSSYSATAKVLVHNGNLNEINATSGIETKISATDTCLEIFNSQDIFVYFKNTALSGSDYSAEDYSKMITVTAEGEKSLVFEVTVTCDNPEDALMITQKFVGIMYPYISQYVGRASVNIIYIDSVASAAHTDVIPAVVLSFLAGAILASAVIIMLAASNRRLKNAEDFKTRYSVKLLGAVPDFENERGKNNGR